MVENPKVAVVGAGLAGLRCAEQLTRSRSVDAGEHTVLSTMGYLDGAVASGERAAREVLAALGQ